MSASSTSKIKIPTQELPTLIKEAESHLIEKLQFSVNNRYVRTWNGLLKFLVEKKIKKLDDSTFLQFAKYVQSSGKYPRWQKRLPDVYKCLLEFHTNREITPLGKQKKERHFKKQIGKYFIQFLNSDLLRKYSNTTYTYIKINAFHFYEYCVKTDIHHPKEFTILTIHEYLHSNKGNHETRIYALRLFLKYLFESALINKDIASKIPTIKRPIKKLPSVYSPEEIAQVLNSIDRSSPIGKRDYSIMLMAFRYGFRSVDIANLKFNNIDWQANTISFTQSKTSVQISQALLPDVGNAIINYLKFARIKSKSPNVFLYSRAPYLPLSAAAITSIFKYRYRSSGISINGRRHGSHSARHSFVARLVKHKVSIPIMINLLGHLSRRAHKKYVSVDIDSLRECTLSVPEVPKGFYDSFNHILNEKR